ncbi:hypothetical protein KUTeg_013391 [Tegillarca granosa]|uniref:Uncharacterized protein n=1 Tax=Tegillarca granosa TaxID=220873 RepID=A0ABQ9EY09_TEGGR|nr:hypothetical protein KUTeg_013391 [Tegillarca granosa]
MMEYNPNYDFVGAKYPEQQLTEINRNKLHLVRALGQGAFGDVYKGYLAGVPHVAGELPVAIKDNDPCVLCVADLLKLAVDVAKGCQHLEEKHFIHR